MISNKLYLKVKLYVELCQKSAERVLIIDKAKRSMQMVQNNWN